MPKMRIQLIYPDPNPRVGLSGRKIESAALQLLAALTPPEHEVSIVQEHLGDPVRFDDPRVDLVGITAMTIQARRAYEIADSYRNAGKKVVLGGIHPSVQPDEALQHADAVVVGEVEPVWSQVLADAAAGQLRGIYRGTDFADLTQLPPYRREMLPKRSSLSLRSVQAARGCPYDCSFCSATLFTGRKYRFRPVENVIAEVKALQTRFIFFLDDNIFSNEAYCRALFSELKKLNVISVGQASSISPRATLTCSSSRPRAVASRSLSASSRFPSPTCGRPARWRRTRSAHQRRWGPASACCTTTASWSWPADLRLRR